MTDPEIRAAFEKLFRLHSAAGEAAAQFAAMGAIREVIFRPGSGELRHEDEVAAQPQPA